MGANGLAQMCIHAGIEAALSVAGHGAGGDGDDGNIDAACPQPSGGLVPVTVGHLTVHEDDLGQLLLTLGNALQAIGSHAKGDVEALEEGLKDCLVDGVVFGGEYPATGERGRGPGAVRFGWAGCGSFEWQREPEPRANAWSGRNLEYATHSGDQPTTDRQAQAGATVLSLIRAVELLEWLEDALEISLVDAGPGVLDDDTKPIFFGRERE